MTAMQQARRRNSSEIPEPIPPTSLHRPPADEMAEQSVLGAMLLSKDAVADVIEQIGHTDFYFPRHQMIFSAIIDLFSRGEPADAVMVAASLDRVGTLARIGGAPYLHTLLSLVPTAANASYYAGIVREKSTLRQLVEAGTRITQYGYSGVDGADVDAVVDRAQAEMFALGEARSSEDYCALDDLVGPALDELEALTGGGAASRGVATGFADLDDLTNGLQPGQMIVVAARPGVGKALALNTPLPTPGGWTTMGQVAVGDQLIGADGFPTTVVAATDIMRGRPCYRIVFSDGTEITADEQHQWPLHDGSITTTGQLQAGMTILQAQPLALPDDESIADPFEVGQLLGSEDYSRRGGAQIDRCRHRCLRGGARQRQRMLEGVLSSAATATGAPQGWLVVEQRALVADLMRSLGHRLHHHRPGQFPLPSPDPITVVQVQPVPSVAVRCVQVDNADHLYLAGSGMIPTHNSTLGLDIMRSCSLRQRKTSIIFSLEMSKSEIVTRLLSAETGVRLSALRSGKLDDDDWIRLSKTIGDISGAPLYIDDSPNLTMTEIRAKARRLRQQSDTKLIVVDYLQLMTSGKRVESRQQEVSEFSRQLKLLAKELEVPVVAISQLNRGPEQRTDKRPMLSDLRESGAIEQDADMVMLLHRPDAFERDDPRCGEADLIIAKHRNGPTRTITLAHQLHISRFANLGRM